VSAACSTFGIAKTSSVKRNIESTSCVIPKEKRHQKPPLYAFLAGPSFSVSKRFCLSWLNQVETSSLHSARCYISGVYNSAIDLEKKFPVYAATTNKPPANIEIRIPCVAPGAIHLARWINKIDGNVPLSFTFSPMARIIDRMQIRSQQTT
jgi:hypothetical protein